MEYQFKAMDASGKTTVGTVEASSTQAAALELKERKLTILDLKEAASKSGPSYAKSEKLEPFGVALNDILFFTRQFASLVSAGVPILTGLVALGKNTSSGRLRAALAAIISDVERGLRLTDAFGKHPKVFNPMYLSLLEVGEASGNIPSVLNRLADYLEKQADIARKLRGAMAYPCFILVFSTGLVYAMLVYLFPGFQPMFTSSGLDLNQYPITLTLIYLSKIVNNRYFLFVTIPCVVAALVALRWALTTKSGKIVFDRMLWHMPAIGTFIQTSVMAGVARGFATLLHSGINMVDAIDLAAKGANNTLASSRLGECKAKIQAGASISATFEKSGIFPPLMLSMIAIGEQSGELESMFERVATFYDRELDGSLSAVTALIEPVMMVGVGGIVGTFIMGIMLPIIGIVQAVENQI